MPVLPRNLPPENEALRRFGGPLLPAALGESLGAAFEDPTLAPLELLGVQAEIARAQNQGREIVGSGRGRRAVHRAPPEDLVAPEDLNEAFKELGLGFDKPTRRGVAEILAREKRAELIRRDVIARAPGGFLPGAARFGAGLARAALDPLNVASAFVPVVSQARFAGLVARLGVSGARVSRGVIEGAVGNALIEPLVAGLSIGQQRDYTLADSLVNVALGGVLGGGLHLGFGRISDFIAARRPETREALLRVSVAQVAEGRSVDLDPVLRAELEALGLAFDEVRARPLGPVDEPLVRLKPEVFEQVLVERGPAFERGGEIVVQGKELQRLFGTSAGFGLVKVIFRHGEGSGKAPAFQATRQDLLALPQVLRDFAPSRVVRGPDGTLAAADFRVTLEDPRFGPREVVFGIRKFTAEDGENRLVTAFVVEPQRGVSFGPSPLRQAQEGAGAAGSPGAGFKPAVGDTAPGRFDPDRGGRAAPAPDNIGPRPTRRQRLLSSTADAARREALPARDATADFDALARIERELAEAGEDPGQGAQALQLELDFLDEQLGALRQGKQLTKAETALLDEAEVIAKRAKAQANGVRAAALCLRRTP